MNIFEYVNRGFLRLSTKYTFFGYLRFSLGYFTTTRGQKWPYCAHLRQNQHMDKHGCNLSNNQCKKKTKNENMFKVILTGIGLQPMKEKRKQQKRKIKSKNWPGVDIPTHGGGGGITTDRGKQQKYLFIPEGWGSVLQVTQWKITMEIWK